MNAPIEEIPKISIHIAAVGLVIVMVLVFIGYYLDFWRPKRGPEASPKHPDADTEKTSD